MTKEEKSATSTSGSVEQYVPTPFGNGILEVTDRKVSLHFTGPMAKEAVEWIVGAKDRERQDWIDCYNFIVLEHKDG